MTQSPIGPLRTPARPLLAALLVVYVAVWPALTLTAAWCWSRSPWLGLGFSLFPLLHVWVQLGFFYHELWHNHFFARPGPNKFFFQLVSVLIFSNPQIYGNAHRSHHQSVHTFDDLEFWPAGEPSSPAAARLQLLAELLLGNIAWALRAGWIQHRGPDHDLGATLRFLALFASTQTALAYATHRLTGWWGWLPLSYGFSLWLFAIALRYLQFSEHLGILAPEASLDERNRLTRHVSPEGLLGQLWQLFTMNDSGNHMDHHLWPRQPNRWPLPGSQTPPTDPGTVIPVTALPGIFWRALLDPLARTPPRPR